MDERFFQKKQIITTEASYGISEEQRRVLERRTRYEIYADLLWTVMKRKICLVTRASYGANLPVDRTKKFLRFLASRGFVREERIDGSVRYRITKRGLEYLETFKKMKKMFAALSEES